MRLTANLICNALTGGPCGGPESERALGMVRTDSRRVMPGDVFFCLRGEHGDGHDFAKAALDAGAGLVVAHRRIPGLDKAAADRVLLVDDTLAAMGRLARRVRSESRATVLAVTGTAGKTSVKEMLAQVGSRELRTCKNYKNFNNQIGLPLAVFAAEPEADLWVLELGISRPGDMDELGRIAAPDLALITNVGPAHLEGLGSVAGVAEAKASLLDHLAPDGTAILCRDHPLLTAAAGKRSIGRVVEFSALDEDAPYCCRFTGANEEGDGVFKLRTPEFKAEMVLPLCGEHWAENMAAVAAAAGTLGLSRQAVLGGISAFQPAGQRFVRHCFGRLTVIDDSYNANPLSMTRAVRTARALAGDSPLVLVLGDMLELGDTAAEAHETLGRDLSLVHPAAVFFQGAHASDVARGFCANGASVQAVEGPDDLLPALDAFCSGPAVVLVKGSRSCRMEKYVAALTERCRTRTEHGTKQGADA